MFTDFKYKHSCKIIYNSCSFDSLLELKFALSIEREFEYLRAAVPIFYDPVTLLATNVLTEQTKKYTPDFLMRGRDGKEACLIELKPAEYRRYEDQLKLRTIVAENYISWKGLDWKFKFLFDDEIHLNEIQEKKFEHLRKKIGISATKLRFQDLDKKYNRSQPNFFKGTPGHLDKVAGLRLIQFVKYGKVG